MKKVIGYKKHVEDQHQLMQRSACMAYMSDKNVYMLQVS